MKSDVEKLQVRHRNLIHSTSRKVISHVQRIDNDWFVNTLMIEGCEVPFRYKRKRKYKSIAGQRVNLTYYASTENVAGLDFEVMTVVRVKIA